VSAAVRVIVSWSTPGCRDDHRGVRPVESIIEGHALEAAASDRGHELGLVRDVGASREQQSTIFRASDSRMSLVPRL
jgi:hypothetical protein